jgi:hypothetical protein
LPSHRPSSFTRTRYAAFLRPREADSDFLFFLSESSFKRSSSLLRRRRSGSPSTLPSRDLCVCLSLLLPPSKLNFSPFHQFGLGLKTQAVLAEAGIPSVVVLDSAVAYIMSRCDMAVVGAEAVCESGGLVNFVRRSLSVPSTSTDLLVTTM